jgi:hypothetical protein
MKFCTWSSSVAIRSCIAVADALAAVAWAATGFVATFLGAGFLGAARFAVM